MRFEVWHANDLFAAMRSHLGGSPKPEFPAEYTMVGVVDAASLDAAFALTNNIDRAWVENSEVAQSLLEARSTSVGDVFVGDGVAHRVEPFGFERLTPEAPLLDQGRESFDPRVRELFDATVRTAFAESALRDPSQFASRSLEESRDRFVERAEAGWDAFREEVGGFPPGRVEQLAARFAAYEATFNPHLIGVDAPLRQLTVELIECCQLDQWPGRATVVDFGLESPGHLGALQYAHRDEVVTPRELDAAMGHGEWLTAIAQRDGENPYRDAKFHTAWDDIRRTEAEFPEFAEPRPVRPTITAVDPPQPKIKPLTM